MTNTNKDKKGIALNMTLKRKIQIIVQEDEVSEVSESNEEEEEVSDIDTTENIITEDSADLTVQKDLDIIGDIIDDEDDVDFSESLDSKEQEKKSNINY